MKHLFICSTPFQVMIAVNMSMTSLKDDEVTLYFLDHSNDYKNLFKRIANTHCFHKVFLLKTNSFNRHWTQKYKFIRYMVKGLEYLNHKRFSMKFIDDPVVYDKFWVSYMDRSSWLIFLTYKKRNLNLKLSFFEDGLGSYELLAVKTSNIEKKLCHLLGYKSMFEEMKTLLVFEPDLLINTLYPQIEVLLLPKITDSMVKNTLNEVLGFKTKDLEVLKYKYIFLESPFQSNEINKQQIEMIKFLSDDLGDNFCVKLHPRSTMDTYENKKIILNTKISMEGICLNANIEQNVLFSVFSTASMTPKLIFSQEPVIIFLYKLFKLDEFSYTGLEDFKIVEGFQNSYSKPNRLFVPESIDELKKVLEKLNVESSLKGSKAL